MAGGTQNSSTEDGTVRRRLVPWLRQALVVVVCLSFPTVMPAGPEVSRDFLSSFPLPTEALDYNSMCAAGFKWVLGSIPGPHASIKHYLLRHRLSPKENS